MLKEIGEYCKLHKDYIGFKITNIKVKGRGCLKIKMIVCLELQRGQNF